MKYCPRNLTQLIYWYCIKSGNGWALFLLFPFVECHCYRRHAYWTGIWWINQTIAAGRIILPDEILPYSSILRHSQDSKLGLKFYINSRSVSWRNIFDHPTHHRISDGWLNGSWKWMNSHDWCEHCTYFISIDGLWLKFCMYNIKYVFLIDFNISQHFNMFYKKIFKVYLNNG